MKIFKVLIKIQKYQGRGWGPVYDTGCGWRVESGDMYNDFFIRNC